MSRRINLNLEVNRRLSRGSNCTPASERSVESSNSTFSNRRKALIVENTSKELLAKDVIAYNEILIKDNIIKDRETIYSRIRNQVNTDKDIVNKRISNKM
jgi:hypothetical protein